MKGIKFRSILLSIGLGLVCISIVYFVFISGDGIINLFRNISGPDSYATNEKMTVVSANTSNGYSIGRPSLSAEHVIMLDGETPRLLSNSDIAKLEGELLALDNEIAAIADSLKLTPDKTSTDSKEYIPTTAAKTSESEANVSSTKTAPSQTTASLSATVPSVAEETTITSPVTTTSSTTTPVTTTTSTITNTTTTIASTTLTTTTTTTTTAAPTTTTTTTTTTAPTTTTTTAELTTTTTAAPAPSTTITQAVTAESYATIVVARGDTATKVANKLYNLGLISSTDEFLERLRELQLTGELLDGTFELPYGLDLDTLIDRIRVHK